jgi:dGTPase
LIEEANVMVMDKTMKELDRHQVRSVKEARNLGVDIVSAPAEEWQNFNKLKTYLQDNVYDRPQVCIMNEKGKLIINRIFQHLEKSPGMLPKYHKARFEKGATGKDKRIVIKDYIAGMTDRYAMDLYKMMFEPYEKVMYEFRD